MRKRLTEESSNTNVRALLQAIPKDGRPGNFWNRLLAEPLVSAFPGVKMVELEGFPYFPDRKIILSVGLQNTKIWILTNLRRKFVIYVWLRRGRL